MNKFLLTVAALAVSTAAQASIIPTLSSITPVGSNFMFTYDGYLSGDQGLVAGDQLDIFNFAGYVPGSVTAGGNPDVVATVVTGDPSGLSLPPGVSLIPGDVTLVFTYEGPPYDTSGGPFGVTLFSGLGAQSIYGGSALIGAYSAVAENNTGPETGTATFNFGFEAVPFPIPEPATWALMLIGAAATGASLRNRRNLAAA
jgi:hypothetical protein